MSTNPLTPEARQILLNVLERCKVKLKAAHQQQEHLSKDRQAIAPGEHHEP